MRQLLVAFSMLMAGAAFPATEEAPFSAPNEELRAYLLEAAEHHPKLKAMHEEWLAALETIPQAAALDDPMFSYTQFVQSRMDNYTLMLEQKFPWFGMRKVQGERAAENAEAARLRMFAARNEIAARLKVAYFEYAYLAEQIKVLDPQIELLVAAEKTVLDKYAVGMAAQDELLRIQSEQSKVRDMRAQVDQMRPAVRAKLNEALGCALDEERPWPQEAAPPPAPPEASLLKARLRENNPDLLALDHDIAGREKDVDLAKRKNYPDITVRLEFMKGKYEGRMNEDPWSPGKLMAYRDLARTATGAMPFNALDTGINLYEAGVYSAPGTPPEDKVALGVTVNLPVWRKRIHGGVQEALHQVAAAEWNKETLARELESDANMALFEIQDATRRQGLYLSDLIPKAQQTYTSLEAAYASGEEGVSFLDMLDSIQAILEFDLQNIRAARDLQQAAARLEMILGGPWTTAGSSDRNPEEPP